MDLKKLDLKERIKELEEQLEEAKSHTYIHETNHLYCQDGEMHFGFGEDKWLVYNTDQLFKDLPFIINQVVKENKKMQDYYLGKIKDELKELDPDDKTTTKEIPGFEGTLEKLNNL
tara:strand:- start:7274 stop:7621 length:348 start_codon:yes stop_codon:yes gene_type:complete